jgi:hypothetical protein
LVTAGDWACEATESSKEKTKKDRMSFYLVPTPRRVAIRACLTSPGEACFQRAHASHPFVNKGEITLSRLLQALHTYSVRLGEPKIPAPQVRTPLVNLRGFRFSGDRSCNIPNKTNSLCGSASFSTGRERRRSLQDARADVRLSGTNCGIGGDENYLRVAIFGSGR